jgi:hypothetical protein
MQHTARSRTVDRRGIGHDRWSNRQRKDEPKEGEGFVSDRRPTV